MFDQFIVFKDKTLNFLGIFITSRSITGFRNDDSAVYYQEYTTILYGFRWSDICIDRHFQYFLNYIVTTIRLLKEIRKDKRQTIEHYCLQQVIRNSRTSYGYGGRTRVSCIKVNQSTILTTRTPKRTSNREYFIWERGVYFYAFFNFLYLYCIFQFN